MCIPNVHFLFFSCLYFYYYCACFFKADDSESPAGFKSSVLLLLKNIMVEQKRLKDIVEGAKPRPKTLTPIAPKPPTPIAPKPPVRFPDQIEFTETPDKKEKQNSDKTVSLSMMFLSL